METISLILLPYLILATFTNSVIEHASNFKGASKAFRTILLLVGTISIIGIITICILIGLKEKWWIALLFGIGGFIISSFIESIILRIIGNKIFILSSIGIFLIPLTLYIILDKLLF